MPGPILLGRARGRGDACPHAVSLWVVPGVCLSNQHPSASVGPLPSVLSLRPCPCDLHSFCSNHLFFVSASFSRLYLP